MNRLLALPFALLVLSAAVVLASPAGAASTASGTLLTATIPSTSLKLSTGETVTVRGELSVAIAQFNVQDGKIVTNATLAGSLTATTSSGETVVVTFTNTRIVARVTDLQADCQAGTLSFTLQALVPTNSVDVTVNETPVSLKGPIKLTVPIAISTADISDPATAGKVGAIICQIDRLLKSGGSLDRIVNQLNALLRTLA
jgi:Ca2+-dependent lipid-binding protein